MKRWTLFCSKLWAWNMSVGVFAFHTFQKEKKTKCRISHFRQFYLPNYRIPCFMVNLTLNTFFLRNSTIFHDNHCLSVAVARGWTAANTNRSGVHKNRKTSSKNLITAFISQCSVAIVVSLHSYSLNGQLIIRHFSTEWHSWERRTEGKQNS